MLSQRAMKPEFIVLGLIVAGALYLFWTQKLHTDVTAVLVMLSLAVPWPRPDGRWSAILSPQEAFSGFGSVAVIMVTAMFVFSASMIRTGAAEMIASEIGVDMSKWRSAKAFCSWLGLC